MKKASIRQIQHHFSKVLEYIKDGEEVFITNRNKIVAKIVPAGETAASPDIKYPDFVNRAKSIVPQPHGIELSELIVENRKA